jgi:hypothetical protein
MNSTPDITKLLELVTQYNNEHVCNYISFVVKHSDISKETLHNLYSKFNSNINATHCEYVFKRGKNNGEKCNTSVKDGKTFCYKHFKQDKVEITNLELDLENISDEDVSFNSDIEEDIVDDEQGVLVDDESIGDNDTWVSDKYEDDISDHDEYY